MARPIDPISGDVTVHAGGLYTVTRDGDPPDTELGVGAFMWNELWTSDSEAARGFYGGLLGWAADDERLPGSPAALAARGTQITIRKPAHVSHHLRFGPVHMKNRMGQVV